MVHILVTGAAGYIGLHTAIALREKGHTVYGVVKQQSQVNTMELNEIIPVLTNMADGKFDPELLAKVSVVIDNVSNYSDKTPFDSNRNFLKEIHAASRQSVKDGNSRKRYIYTSGLLVYGNYGGAVVDETFPRKAPSPRIALEKEIIALNGPELETVVLRPSWVYGGSDGRYSVPFWLGNAKDEIEIHGNPNKYWNWVHIADLASAYVLAVEASGQIVGGEVFDVADDTRLTFEQARVLMARTHGVKGPVVLFPAGSDAWSQLCESDAIAECKKIRRLLQWHPRFIFSDSVKRWHAAVQAAGHFNKK